MTSVLIYDRMISNQNGGRIMKGLMTRQQVEKYFTEKWGQQAYLNPYRICGNRWSWAVIDGSNWQNVVWVNGQQLFRL